MINITKIPNEILVRIFYNLDLRSLGQTAQVCQKFNKTCQNESIWKKLANREYGSKLIKSKNFKTLCLNKLKVIKNLRKNKFKVAYQQFPERKNTQILHVFGTLFTVDSDCISMYKLKMRNVLKATHLNSSSQSKLKLRNSKLYQFHQTNKIFLKCFQNKYICSYSNTNNGSYTLWNIESKILVSAKKNCFIVTIINKKIFYIRNQKLYFQNLAQKNSKVLLSKISKAIKWTHSGDYFAVLSDDKKIHIIDLKVNKKINEILRVSFGPIKLFNSKLVYNKNRDLYQTDVATCSTIRLTSKINFYIFSDSRIGYIQNSHPKILNIYFQDSALLKKVKFISKKFDAILLSDSSSVIINKDGTVKMDTVRTNQTITNLGKIKNFSLENEILYLESKNRSRFYDLFKNKWINQIKHQSGSTYEFKNSCLIRYDPYEIISLYSRYAMLGIKFRNYSRNPQKISGK